MSYGDFIKGMSVGLIVGTAVGLVMTPKKSASKNIVCKAAKAIGDVVDSVTKIISD